VAAGYPEEVLDMSARTKLGLVLLGAGALVAGTNAWAARAYPDQWGGPNIGGGFIQLLAYTAMATGVGFLVAAAVRRKRNRPAS
jgi:hypothetical protein